MATISLALLLADVLIAAITFRVADASTQQLVRHDHIPDLDLANQNAVGLKVKLVTVRNDGGHDGRLVMGVRWSKVLNVKNGAVAVLGP